MTEVVVLLLLSDYQGFMRDISNRITIVVGLPRIYA